MEKEEKDLRKKIKETLAKQLGVEPDDIEEDDTFKVDLHMNPVDLTDFAHSLGKLGINSESLDFNEIESLADLFENIL